MNQPSPPGPEEQPFRENPPPPQRETPHDAVPQQPHGGPVPPPAGWTPPHDQPSSPSQPPPSQPYPAPPYPSQPYPAPPAPAGWAQPGFGPYAPAAGPPGPVRMPGAVIAARVLLFVGGGLYALGALVMFVLAGSTDRPEFVAPDGTEPSAATVAGLATWLLVIGGPAILAASLFGRGRRGVRVLAIVAGSLLIFSGLGNAGGGNPAGLVVAALGVLAIVFVAGAGGRSWFTRPTA